MDEDDSDRGARDEQMTSDNGAAADAMFGPFSVRGPGVQIILDGRPISWPNEGE